MSKAKDSILIFSLFRDIYCNQIFDLVSYD